MVELLNIKTKTTIKEIDTSMHCKSAFVVLGDKIWFLLFLIIVIIFIFVESTFTFRVFNYSTGRMRNDRDVGGRRA